MASIDIINRFFDVIFLKDASTRFKIICGLYIALITTGIYKYYFGSDFDELVYVIVPNRDSVLVIMKYLLMASFYVSVLISISIVIGLLMTVLIMILSNYLYFGNLGRIEYRLEKSINALNRIKPTCYMIMGLPYFAITLLDKPIIRLNVEQLDILFKSDSLLMIIVITLEILFAFGVFCRMIKYIITGEYDYRIISS